MSHGRKALSRTLSALLTAVLGVLALSAPAAAQVSIVPDRVAGGGTQTFAFRLANERADTKSTRLELVFPQNPPVAYVEVAPAQGWTATVRPRPLDPPLQAGGKVISEAAGTLVFEGGAVAPKQFEQFLVTMGPLPADGRLCSRRRRLSPTARLRTGTKRPHPHRRSRSVRTRPRARTRCGATGSG